MATDIPNCIHLIIRTEIPGKTPVAALTVGHSDWLQDPVQAATNSDTAHSSSET
jgi:hypothetical protein